MIARSSLLPLFKGQLNAECAVISERLALRVPGHFLIYWYFQRLLEFTDEEVGEVICDGGGDLGIDALWIDDDAVVHFYQFKNPESANKGVHAGEVDKLISGLKLILHRKHEQIANPELKARLDEVYQQLPSAYRIHVISSGQGVPAESKIKLDALIDELSNPSASLIGWDEQDLGTLQEMFYQQNLSAVKEAIRLKMTSAPYMLRSGAADTYLFSVPGAILADLYDQHGEGLLQRNIRVDQRNTATNRSIEGTCSSLESMNFVHFNNGVTFLCEEATFDIFQQTLSLVKAQVVNGGQTIRAIHRASKKGTLKQDVIVPARAIASSGDKDFANNVAVNQNNQNQIGTGFLRSNDQFVVQLDHALASLGWYLERREGELKAATESEKHAIQQRIGGSLDGRVIKLKEGAQAYTATFFGQPETAKKNVKKIFLSVDDGGFFERIFSADMTAEKIVIAHELKGYVDEFVNQFVVVHRKFQASNDIVDAYRQVLGDDLAEKHSDYIHQVMPQCSLFVCGTLFKDLTELQKRPASDIPKIMKERGDPLIREHILHIVEFVKQNKEKADRSWPVLLKSNPFFNHVSAYLAGIRRATQIAA